MVSSRIKLMVGRKVAGFLLLFVLAFPLCASWERVLYRNTDCIALNPITHTMFVGVFNEGIYRTNLEGKGWENIRFGPGPALSVHCLAIDPNNPKIIYAGTDKGLFKSNDGGWGWKKLSIFAANIAIDPRNSEVVYADRYKSTNGGLSWSQIIQSAYHTFDVAVDGKSGILYYTGSILSEKSRGLYRSSDGGVTWKKLLDQTVTVIVIDSRRPGRIYVGGEGKVYRSLDGGDSWVDLEEGLPQGLIHSMLIDPLNPNIIYAGVDMAGVYRSEDGGETWSLLGKGFPDTVKIMDLAIDPSSPDFLYAATISGVPFGNEYGLWRMELPPRKPFHSVSPLGKLPGMWGGIKMDGGLNPLKRR